jgi:hypothetical protein
VLDLLVAELLHRPHQLVPRVVDHDIDRAKLSERTVDDRVDLRGISHVQVRQPQQVTVHALEIRRSRR